MNATRSLAQNVLRCTRLSVTSLSATRSRFLKMSTSSLHVARPRVTAQFVRPMSSSAKTFQVINIQDEQDFKKRVLDASSSTPIVVDFHATWCGPCKMLGPRLETLLGKEDGRVLFAKVDVDEHPDLAMEYGVRSVPTVVGMKNGQVQNQFTGVIEDDQITAFVDKLVVS